MGEKLDRKIFWGWHNTILFKLGLVSLSFYFDLCGGGEVKIYDENDNLIDVDVYVKVENLN